MAKIGFIGLGNMGSKMCANLVAAKHDVKAFDIKPDIEIEGAVFCASIAEAIAGREIIITMLPSGEHVREVYFGEGGITAHIEEATDVLLIDCSTIAVEDARAVATGTSQMGLVFMDAPVSGGVAAAQAGTLTFMVGGSEEAFTRAQPILSDLGKNIFHAGGAGNGQAAKIANNMLLAISMIGTCEAFHLAEKLGLSSEVFFNITSNASGQCWSITSYCPAPGQLPNAPSNRNYQAGFTAAMMLKDLRLAMRAAGAAGSWTPLGQHAKTIYQKNGGCGYGIARFFWRHAAD